MALLAYLELPAHERHTVESCLRQVDLIDEELEAIDRAIAERALADERIRRLMTIPGVDVVAAAAALVATIGEIERFHVTRIKLRRLELRCGPPPLTGRRPPVRIYPTAPQRVGERAMLEQAEAAYLRVVSDWRSTRPRA